MVRLWQRCERERTLFRVRIAERCLAAYSVQSLVLSGVRWYRPLASTFGRFPGREIRTLKSTVSAPSGLLEGVAQLRAVWSVVRFLCFR
eukprot:scaffold40919_cov80-Phaeocystis_antarctica.AAC.1